MRWGRVALAGPLLLCLGAWTCASATAAGRLAMTPPMGWNDWAHYQCDYTAATILANARALVRTGLAARGYDTVTIDDCWMTTKRDKEGNLQPDPLRFPHGMRPVAAAIHALGLKFGIYEDAGYETCGRFAGSGEPKGGGTPHFLADARLFASWGVDYLKLDGCNVNVRKGESQNAAYRAAYRAESDALRQVNRPIVFSESAPAYFQGEPAWYDVLAWVRGYGQLWREGTDIDVYDSKNPDGSRFSSVLWNYEYNLPLGRYQSPGNWDDSDFIIGGDRGMTLAESRSQLALWAMMSAPLILSSDLDRQTPAALRILGNRAVLAVDQDPLGRMATLLRRNPASDVLVKPLRDGDYAVAVLNRSAAALPVRLLPADLGFAGNACRFDTKFLWSGAHQPALDALRADVAAHDTAIWTIRPSAACGTPARIGTVTRILQSLADANRATPDLTRYTLCLAASGVAEQCAGTAAETWEITGDGALRSGGKCLAQSGDRAVLSTCSATAGQAWQYDLHGQLVNSASRQCLTAPTRGALEVKACGNNLPSQIWSLPGSMTRPE
ncbi:MAG TPA: ricin-type beta-trefoil lectin domain protein [Steroidobacteraceae bacterium]|nr:ricin-type beta-trefoil lectin domain protein [Steroidobacteraceae bacterium]